MERSLHELFTQVRRIIHTHSLMIPVDFSNMWKHCYRCFSTQYEIMCFSATSSHCLAALPAKMPAFNSRARKKRLLQHHYLKWSFEDFFPRYCYAIKTNDKTIRLPVSQPAFAGKRKDRGHEWSPSSLLHETRTVNLTLAQCECQSAKYTVKASMK